ncbi:ribonucleoside triphosphate reductase [Natronoflexus pectinivorans]|uniref:Ribonucleoside-triphosphate reductase class III catalytic subunit n=1 Tax=Natronoflexus pectinivorans TaxID=682526 RepID=A0A4R2GDM4_9BACT|nr:ribonucleoside triphosphate reductase [Natronoflexus pectinivorans]TCO06033.1 ribonucleoside-triphosphate reductase class III catalytic subunit [Natronoflexus pectinivorans]
MELNGALQEIKLRKRDGRITGFDAEKITYAIFRTLRACGKPNRQLAEDLMLDVLKALAVFENPAQAITVEQVQDEVEMVLFNNKLFDVAKAYILYRKQHESLRNSKELLSNTNLVDDYLNLNDWRIRESANSSYSLQGLNQHLATALSSQYWMERIYPEAVKEAFLSGKIHIHDLGFLSVYCVGWDLEDLLLSGFTGVTGKVESKPAKHFRTALGQIVNFFYTMQGEAAGAQAFSNFDTYLAPFIRYDNLSFQQVKQALQEFMFNINVPTRVGFQTPFTNITMDLKIPDFLKNQPVIIGGKPQNEVYGGFQKELDVFNRAFASVMAEGDANGRVFSFPIPTYNITPDFEWDNPAYEKIWEITAKYGIPYFSNFVNSDMSPDDVRSMCCRLRLDKRELQKKGGGLFGANPLTGSVGVVTINLPRIGYESKSEEEFFQRLDKLMELAKESLEIKRKVIENLTDNGLYPYSKFYLRHVKSRTGKFWTNHFSTIGIVGMNECCLNFLGNDLTSQSGSEFALRVMDIMRLKLELFQEETGNIYNLEATPAEGTSYRLAKMDKQLYPEIMVANNKELSNGAKPYYTNSTQLPVGYTNDMFEALSIQDKFQVKYTGGTVFHTFIGESLLSNESVKTIIKKVTHNFRLPYMTISPTFSICPSHGYIFGEHHQCPKCAEAGESSTCEVYSRIVGYIRPVNQWNDGKQEEFKERKLFHATNEA